MNTNHLKKFAQAARRKLLSQVGARLEYVLSHDSAALREKTRQIKALRDALTQTSKEQLIEKVAYTWFNRLMALRFMDANDFQPSGIRILSPREGYTLPELLDEVKQGHFPKGIEVDRQQVLDLLDGRMPSSNPQNEAFRLLLIGACNALHKQFPFLFERIEDYTELLLPDDLTSEFSVVHDMVQGMSEDDCREVEIIGWLYQFYISEKKDEVFASKGKVKQEDIPAATQLFTPRWIVEYMVQNTLGKLWLQNRPQSRLREHMPYFIESASKEGEDYLQVDSVEELTLLDQACGSGHILVYAFELLTKIYEEEGYTTSEIPGLIIGKNLHGFEIDERAAQLAGFALLMKARSYYRRVFRKELRPHLLCYQDLLLDEDERASALQLAGVRPDESLKHDLALMSQATNLGSLIRPHTPRSVLNAVREQIAKAIPRADLFERAKLEQLKRALGQLQQLAQQFHCVVDNPPYMGGGNMNKPLSDFVKKEYPASKSDLMACFMEAGLDALHPKGFLGMINQHSWMFLSSYVKLREKLIKESFFDTLLHLGPRTFPEIGGEVVQNAAFTFWNKKYEADGTYIRLVDEGSSEGKRTKTLEAVQNPDCGWHYTANQKDFEKIPGSPVGYWVSEKEMDLYKEGSLLSEYAHPAKGIDTGENDYFLRFWSEVKQDRLDISYSKGAWVPYNKGGDFRRWYGNKEHILRWANDGSLLKARVSWTKRKPSLRNREKWFKEGFTWTTVSSSGFSARYTESGALFDNGGCTLFAEKDLTRLGILINSKVADRYFEFLSPTLNFQPGGTGALALHPDFFSSKLDVNLGLKCISISQSDWNSRETSWDLLKNELLRHPAQDLEESYDLYRQYWSKKFFQLHRNEEELNRELIHIYGLQEELTPDVPLKDITILQQELRKNELATLSEGYSSGWCLVDGEWCLVNGDWQLVDGEWKPVNSANPTTLQPPTQTPKLPFDAKEVMAQFVSYAVGCMFGRYALDKEGLILANQGETLEDFLKIVTGDWWMVDGEGNWVLDKTKNQHAYGTKLQGSQNLAAEPGAGEGGVSGDEGDAQGGDVRPDESNQASLGERPEQHRGGASEGNQRIQALSEGGHGFTRGTGNSADANRRSGNDPSGAGQSTSERKNQYSQTDQQPDLKTPNLSAPHQSPPTTHQPPISFLPDDDAIIPVLDDEWFEDDITGRFYEFLKVTYGAQDFRKNLAFLEEQLGKDLRKYFVKDFYKDHIKRYKKRPIYWMFSSPAGAFNVLVYLHRYTPDTLNNILNHYLREFIEKLKARRAYLDQVMVSGSASEKTKAIKESDRIKAMILDCEAYEREILFPLATERIALDLDDGVLVNYNKLGKALKVVPGLNDKKAKEKVRKFDWIDTTEIR